MIYFVAHWPQAPQFLFQSFGLFAPVGVAAFLLMVSHDE